MDESISLPTFWFLRYEYNPSLMVGTEYIWKENSNHDWHFTANLGGYYNKEWQAGIFVNSEIGYRYHWNRWNTFARVGLGYSHTFETKRIYQPDGNGSYSQARNLGNPNFMPSLGLGIGYQLNDNPNSTEIYLHYLQTAELPLNLFTGVHQFVGVGVKFYPFQ